MRESEKVRLLHEKMASFGLCVVRKNGLCHVVRIDSTKPVPTDEVVLEVKANKSMLRGFSNEMAEACKCFTCDLVDFCNSGDGTCQRRDATASGTTTPLVGSFRDSRQGEPQTTKCQAESD